MPANPQSPGMHSTLLLLLLLPALTTAFSCNHLRHQDANFSWKSLQFLQNAAPPPPQPCPQQDATYPFPETLLESKDKKQAAITTLHILQHLFNILNSPHTPTHWIDHARHSLLNQIQHYIHHIEQCFVDQGTRYQKRGPRNSHLTINKYFRFIHNFLQRNNYSACTWDHVRLHVRACFQHVDTLIRQMKSRDPLSLIKTSQHSVAVPRQQQWPPSKRNEMQQGLGQPSTIHSTFLHPRITATERQV